VKLIRFKSIVPPGNSCLEECCKRNSNITDELLFIYNQTGGFRGVNRLYEQELSQLPEPQKKKLEQLIENSGLMKANSERITNSRVRDVFIYDFSFTQAGKTYQAVFDDTTLPESYRPLVEYLKDKVKDQKRG
jgi:hypothetical protein